MSPNGKKPAKHRRKCRLDKTTARIVVVGTGPGGLSTALSLEQAGFTNVLLVERDASVDARKEGYGLTLTYNPRGPLARLGVLEEIAQQDCPSRAHYQFDSVGNVRGYYGNAFVPDRGLGQRGNLRVPRQSLRRTLLRKLNVPILFGKRVERVTQQQSDEKKRLQIRFRDGSLEENIDLLVAADGIRSAVVKSLLPDDAGLKYLNIFIILGIASFHHALLDERGFYTLDGNQRLFTMPYEGTGWDPPDKRRIMWQLSYRLESFEEASRLASLGGAELQQEVLQRCRNWHTPVLDMVKSTPVDTIWGTGLMDRDPSRLIQQLASCQHHRVVVLGDAAHSMSPFKGQGCNQALQDGPLLADWLCKASLDSAIRAFHREMSQRTSKMVQASREAARMLHSDQVLDLKPDFAGVNEEHIGELLRTLQARNIGSYTPSLDEAVEGVIVELGCREERASSPPSSSSPSPPSASQVNLDWIRQQALELAASGSTAGLRTLSLKHSQQIRLARDHRGRSCLHLAAEGGHFGACKWLLTEAFMEISLKDHHGRTTVDAAQRCSNELVKQLLFTQDDGSK